MNKEEKKGLRYMATATVRKWGNSLAIRIPQEVSEKVQFNEGVEIEIYVNDKEQEILLRPVFPAADDQETLRKHFLSLRAQCKAGMSNHEELFEEPEGDEII